MQRSLRFTLLATAAAVMAACGGGGGGDDDDTPAPSTTTPVAIAAMGGLQNAAVCLDANANDACDAGETQGSTAADGKVTLAVPNADVGKYPVLAVVGSGATAYALMAPPDRTAVLSPWSTMVELLRRRSHVNTEQAEAVVREQGSLPLSPLADYSGTGADNAVLARSGRVLLAALQQQLQAVASLAGQPDNGGMAMTLADVQSAVTGAQAGQARAAVVAATSAAVVDACADLASAACGTAIADAATDIHTVTPERLPEYALQRRLQAQANLATGAGQPVAPGFLLDWLTFTDANNWYYRAIVASTAAVAPDANGATRYRDERRFNSSGVVTSYAWVGDPARQGDVHWSGSAWVSCGVDEDAGINTPRDARGVVARSGYCNDAQVSTNQRVLEDVAGKRMGDVVQRIRTTRPDAAGWGPAPETLGEAVFPAGAALIHQTQVELSNAISYDARSSALASVFSAETAAGGDARNGAMPACAVPANQTSTPATSLDVLIERFRGTPCLFDQASFVADGNQITSLAPSAWSGQSTLSIGTLGSAPVGVVPRTAYYTSNTLLRLAFTGPGQVTYYGCRQRWNDGSQRNCDVLGTGGYTISTLGDARVLTLTGEPAVSAGLTYSRVFIERGGSVYFGFRNKLVSGSLMRLNAAAGAALLQQVGMPAVTVP